MRNPNTEKHQHLSIKLIEEKPRKKRKVEGKGRRKRTGSEWHVKFLKVNSATCYPRSCKVIKSVHCNRTLRGHGQV